MISCALSLGTLDVTDSTAAGTARPTLPCGASWSPARTRRYVERRCKEGLTKTEAMRCLKRYIAREVFYYLVPRRSPLTTPR